MFLLSSAPLCRCIHRQLIHKLHCIKSQINMPQESASCKAGLGTSNGKCFRTLIYFSRSINVQTDEYSRQLHLEVCEWHTSSYPEGQRFEYLWWQIQKVFFLLQKKIINVLFQLKRLSHEIDFKNFDQTLKNLT